MYLRRRSRLLPILPILYHEVCPLSLHGILCAWADSSKGCQNLLVLGPTNCTKQPGRYGQLRIDYDIVPVHHTHPCGCRTFGRPASAMHSSVLLSFAFLRASLPIRSSFSIRPSLHQGDGSNIRTYTKLKPRWDVHSRGDENWLGCASEALSSVLGEWSGTTV